MEKREYDVLWNHYFGTGKVTMIWEKEMEQLVNAQTIKRIYEVIDNDYNEIWYLVKDNKEKSYIIKTKYGNLYAKDLMKKYEKKYIFFKISTEIIKIYDKGLYPVVFKVFDNDINNYYDESKNISYAFFNNYYWQFEDKYKAVREYRNKVEYEAFDSEIDAIYWASNFQLTKSDVLNNNIRPLNLMEMVFEYKT